MGRARRVFPISCLDPGGRLALFGNDIDAVLYHDPKPMTHRPHHVMPGAGPASTPLLAARRQGVDAGAKPRHDEEGQAQRRSLSDSAFEPGLSATQACAQDTQHDKGPPVQRFTDFTLLATADAA